jgi:hypothetical protein
LQQVAAFIKTLDEIENGRASTSKVLLEKEEILKKQTEAAYNRKRDLLTVFTPLLTTLILAGTLAFQFLSSQRTETARQADLLRQDSLAEDSRFLEVEKFAGTSEKLSTATTLLKTFTSDRYREKVQDQLSSLVFAKRNIEGEFDQSFSAVYTPSAWNDLRPIIQINRELVEDADPLGRKGWPEGSSSFDSARLSPQEDEKYERLLREIGFTNQTIVILLKSRTGVQSPPDLTDVGLGNADLSGCNLTGAVIQEANFSNAVLDNADLSGITQFERSVFASSPWWHARKVSPELLKYLLEYFPFRPDGVGYPITHPMISPRDYKDSLSRLTR